MAKVEIDETAASEPQTVAGSEIQAKPGFFRRAGGFLRGLDTSQLILIGLLIGVACGLFFGERCARLGLLGDAYIRLLQMTVLPYIVVALISGFGRLRLSNARQLAVDGGRLIAILWAIGIALAFALSGIFPRVSSASFFSTSALHASEGFDPLRIFIPANPFGALAENMVPAVVLFSICIGVALIGVPGKQVLLEVLENLDQALTRLTKAVFKLAPFGVFAISAAAAGTLQLAELSQLQVYLTGYLVGTLLLIFLLVPTIVALLTPVGLSEFLRAMRAALLLGFSAGSSFIVLPLVRDALEELFAKFRGEPKMHDRISEAGIIIPVSFNFPLLGSMLNFLFILFTAWFYNKHLSLSQDVELIMSGILNFFGSSTIAIPFLLDQLKLPADAFELFMIGRILTDRLAVAGNIMGIGGLAVLYVGLRQKAKRQPKRLALIRAGVAIGLVAVVILGVRLLENQVVQVSTADRDLLVNMAVRETVEATVYEETDPLPRIAPEPDPAEHGLEPEALAMASGDEEVEGATEATEATEAHEPGRLLSEIRARGVLRVGYNRNALPFAFFNGQDDLVGYDIAHAHRLAAALECTLEFVPFEYADLGEALSERRFDVAMSAVSLTLGRLTAMDFSRPYVTLNIAFITNDHHRADWLNPADRADQGARIAILKGSAYLPLAAEWFPWAELIEIESRREFFEAEIADAHLTSAEQGAAWTLLYPSFSLVMTEVPLARDPLAYAVPRGEYELRDYLDQWLSITEMSGFSQVEYDRWILGRDPTARVSRWSIAKNVLGWID